MLRFLGLRLGLGLGLRLASQSPRKSPSRLEAVKPHLNLLAARSFYDTVLGPDAGTPGGALAGMPMALLTETWAATFGDDSAPGSCPSI